LPQSPGVATRAPPQRGFPQSLQECFLIAIRIEYALPRPRVIAPPPSIEVQKSAQAVLPDVSAGT
ncbi:MAG: hypothetical protein ACRD6B_18630, partial [Bryobacteraceae bacterium]